MKNIFELSKMNISPISCGSYQLRSLTVAANNYCTCGCDPDFMRYCQNKHLKIEITSLPLLGNQLRGKFVFKNKKLLDVTSKSQVGSELKSAHQCSTSKFHDDSVFTNLNVTEHVETAMNSNVNNCTRNNQMAENYKITELVDKNSNSPKFSRLTRNLQEINVQQPKYVLRNNRLEPKLVIISQQNSKTYNFCNESKLFELGIINHFQIPLVNGTLQKNKSVRKTWNLRTKVLQKMKDKNMRSKKLVPIGTTNKEKHRSVKYLNLENVNRKSLKGFQTIKANLKEKKINKCSQCNVTFILNKNLKQHIMVKHATKGTKVCSKRTQLNRKSKVVNSKLNSKKRLREKVTHVCSKPVLKTSVEVAHKIKSNNEIVQPAIVLQNLILTERKPRMNKKIVKHKNSFISKYSTRKLRSCMNKRSSKFRRIRPQREKYHYTRRKITVPKAQESDNLSIKILSRLRQSTSQISSGEGDIKKNQTKHKLSSINIRKQNSQQRMNYARKKNTVTKDFTERQTSNNLQIKTSFQIHQNVSQTKSYKESIQENQTRCDQVSTKIVTDLDMCQNNVPCNNKDKKSFADNRNKFENGRHVVNEMCPSLSVSPFQESNFNKNEMVKSVQHQIDEPIFSEEPLIQNQNSNLTEVDSEKFDQTITNNTIFQVSEHNFNDGTTNNEHCEKASISEAVSVPIARSKILEQYECHSSEIEDLRAFEENGTQYIECHFDEHFSKVKSNFSKYFCKSYECKFCRELFFSKKSLILHFRKFHRPAYKCNYCDNFYLRKAELLLHIREHTQQLLLATFFGFKAMHKK